MAVTARHRWCMSKLVEAFEPDVGADKAQVRSSLRQRMCSSTLKEAQCIDAFHVVVNLGADADAQQRPV